MSNIINESIKAPAPWQLTGEAFVILYKFSKEFIENNSFLADYQKKAWNGGIGTVMVVNYATSAVGPYFELLFIPGKIKSKDFTVKNLSGYSISKIYVSSQTSVDNGIANWGIPKEKADFKWNEIDVNTTNIDVSINGNVFFSGKFSKNNFKFPVTTSLLPLKVLQKLHDKFILTKPKARGKAKIANIKSVMINQNYFPDLAQQKPIATVYIDNFEMIFPIPEIENQTKQLL